MGFYILLYVSIHFSEERVCEWGMSTPQLISNLRWEIALLILSTGFFFTWTAAVHLEQIFNHVSCPSK